MAEKRTLIVGDVHGCFDELQELLKKASYNKENDRLIFVGDLINKGPKSMDVLNWVKSEGCEVILGNHELGFIRYLMRPDPTFKAFIKLEKEMEGKAKEWGEWMSHFPLYIKEDDFIIVHGGIVPGMKLEETPDYLITRIRTWDGKGEDMYNDEDPPWYEFYKEDTLVVYGHWAGQGLNIRENTIGIDTGCCWGRKLTLLHLETREVFQVDAKEEYAKF
jgi:serine/threonine protein phosphatase 1